MFNYLRVVGTCEACLCETAPLYNVSGVWYDRCAQCGLTQVGDDTAPATVDDVYDDHYFYGGGAGYPNYTAEAQILRMHGQRYARLLSRYTRPGRLLDVGGAAGYIAQGFHDYGWSATVLDPNKTMIAIAASLAEEADLGTLETFTTKRPYDLVLMLQALPHFMNLREALHAARAATTLDGYWLVETWNSDSLTARVLKAQWQEFSPPSVRRIFTLKSLDRLFSDYFFVRIAMGRPQKWLLGSHAKSLLAYKATQSSVMRLASSIAHYLPDSFRIPYPGEDLFWALYQSRVREAGSSS